MNRQMNAEANPVDLERIERAVREILIAVGEDPDREGLRRTPARVARMYEELLAGMRASPEAHLQTIFHEKYDEIVLLRDIPFQHLRASHDAVCRHCECCVPAGRQGVGGDKLARIVDSFARRLQVQERLTVQVADFLMDHLRPKGVAVVIEASHTCMTIAAFASQIRRW